MPQTFRTAALALFALSAPAAAKPPAITIVHFFRGGFDGKSSTSTMTFHNGAMYGTTGAGGIGAYGTIFRVDAQTGYERILYSFRGGSDGASPALAELLFLNNAIYGTTPVGGQFGFGTIFKYDLGSGIETVLYSFAGGQDGATPYSGVFHRNGVLYGVTSAGGNGNCSGGCGTVYKFTLSNKAETVEHSFQGGPDSGDPTGELVPFNGLLFGTTVGAGINCGNQCGTIYSVNPDSSDYSIAYTFQNNTTPRTGMTKLGNYLYGVTTNGGSNDLGEVFRFDPDTSSFAAVLSLGAGKVDGTYPTGRLIFANGSLFGTTSGGGANDDGTVFSVNPSSKKATLLGSFSDTEGGAYGGLTYDGTSFWGTTQGDQGRGIVYKFTLGQ